MVYTVKENVPRLDIVHAVPAADVDHVEAGASPGTKKRKSWKYYFWDSFDKSKAEQRLILKLDLTLMTFGCLGTFIKYIDRSNLNSAFVSGMEEDLSLYGNQLNYANTCYSVANIIALWPSNLLLAQMNPKHFIPLIELGWTISTFGQAAMKNSTQMYVLRTLVGLFEAGHFSALVYLCGAWYQKNELSKRIAIIDCATAIGPMFSSYLQAAAYTGLNGVHGLAGWRWLFLIDGVISIGIIIPQAIFYPDVPARQQPDYMFSAAELELARDRNPKEGRVRQGRFTWAQARRWLLSVDVWLLWAISFGNSIGNQPTASMAFWFKAWNKLRPGSYSVAQINNYPTPIQAVTVAVTLAMAWISDYPLRGSRWQMLVVGGVVNAVVCILLAATPVFPEHSSGKAFRWFLYYNTGWAQASCVMFWSWTHETLAGDPGARAFAGAGLNVWAWVGIATVPLAAFQTEDQPAVVAGNWTAAGCCLLIAVCAGILAYIQHRRKQLYAGEQHLVGAGGAADEGVVEVLQVDGEDGPGPGPGPGSLSDTKDGAFSSVQAVPSETRELHLSAARALR
ncbi:hypothetical protein SCUCBS95973_003669 [Sporothrix curviconia]|uniref:Major facilitator superfamily transporter n=1 Tax=Sporothrix curviconia TaxID=1260050 RepID=A0ABP0BIP3_9PEZI